MIAYAGQAVFQCGKAVGSAFEFGFIGSSCQFAFRVGSCNASFIRIEQRNGNHACPPTDGLPFVLLDTGSKFDVGILFADLAFQLQFGYFVFLLQPN